MNRLAALTSVLVFVALVACTNTDNRANGSQGPQAKAQHLRRLAWQRSHPRQYAAQKAADLAKAKRQEAYKATLAARRYKEDHPCDAALAYEKKAANASGAQTTFDLAVSGLHYANLCTDHDLQVINQGYLLSFKAYAEHQLSSGDSATDMNQAITLLAECQALTGAYGTHVGAQCESQEENDIHTKTNWEMESY